MAVLRTEYTFAAAAPMAVAQRIADVQNAQTASISFIDGNAFELTCSYPSDFIIQVSKPRHMFGRILSGMF